MKNIPVVVFKALPEGKTETTATLLQQCLKVPPTGGFDFATMRARGRVADAIEKATETIALEDADYSTAVEAVKSIRWAQNEKYLIQFAEQFGL